MDHVVGGGRKKHMRAREQGPMYRRRRDEVYVLDINKGEKVKE